MKRQLSPQLPPSPIAGAVLVVLVLLGAPIFTASRLIYPAIDWPVLIAAPILVSLVTFFAYRSDKLRAQTGEWRVPETTLHVLSLLGGWPGALLAQQRYRHKIAKVSFQLIFWLTVLAYQFVAIDALLGWYLSVATWNALKTWAA